MKRMLCIVGGMNAGGAETFLMKIYRALDRSQYQMDFAVAIKDKGFYDDEILSMGGKIFHIVPKSDGFIKNFFDIRRIVKENGYKSVLRTSQHSLSALELLAARLGGAKKLIFRSSNSNTATGNKRDLLLHKICRFMPVFFANVRIAPSKEAAEFMFGENCLKNGHAQIVHNGINLDYYKFDQEARERIRDDFGLKDCYVLGHVGRFNRQKNHVFLIKLFYEYQKQHDDARLLLVGKGELEKEIKELCESLKIKEKVVFAGVRSDMPALYSAMDVFVFPSLYEGMPNAVIEAQACGLKCIVSNTITSDAAASNQIEYCSIMDNEMWIDEITSKQAEKKMVIRSIDPRYDIKNVINSIIPFFD